MLFVCLYHICLKPYTNYCNLLYINLLCDYSACKGATDWWIKNLFVFLLFVHTTETIFFSERQQTNKKYRFLFLFFQKYIREKCYGWTDLYIFAYIEIESVSLASVIWYCTRKLEWMCDAKFWNLSALRHQRLIHWLIFGA